MTVNGYEIGPKANLEGANLEGASLRGANLGGANLRGANLRGANLEGANLNGANLRGASLKGANLGGANLDGANLEWANLRWADLHWAILSGANLKQADLSGAILSGADLRESLLLGANLDGANLGHWSILPAGQLIGYKRIRRVLVTLSIPADARRVHSPSSRKCRAERAVVLAVDNPEGRVVGGYDHNFVYEAGQEVVPDSFDDDIRVCCTHGIHFYITKEEAIGE